MEKYGELFFKEKWHPGKVTVNNDNQIIITVYECDIDSYQEKIEARLENKRYNFYKCYCIGNGIGFYEYQATYAEENNNTTEKNYIYDFRFMFNPLAEWLAINTIKTEENFIKFNIPEDIQLLCTDKLKIKIKYYKEGFNSQYETNNLEEIHVVPYIVVDSNVLLSIEDVQNYIQIITRFFSLFIGYTANTQDIYCSQYDEKKIKYSDIENKLIVNTDFSNNYNDCCIKFRTSYKEVKEQLQDYFNNWFELCSQQQFNNVIIQYFSPYARKSLEEKFLAFVRCIEELYELNNDEKELEIKDERIENALNSFYSEKEQDLKKLLREETGFNSSEIRKYKNKVKDIHIEIIEGIIYSYNTRISLDTKLKTMDKYGWIKEIYENGHIANEKKDELDVNKIYYYLSSTRNLYTHLSHRNKTKIKEKYINQYSRELEKVLLLNLMEKIKMDNTYVKMKLEEDMYLNLYSIVKLIDKKGE